MFVEHPSCGDVAHTLAHRATKDCTTEKKKNGICCMHLAMTFGHHKKTSCVPLLRAREMIHPCPTITKNISNATKNKARPQHLGHRRHEGVAKCSEGAGKTYFLSSTNKKRKHNNTALSMISPAVVWNERASGYTYVVAHHGEGLICRNSWFLFIF